MRKLGKLSEREPLLQRECHGLITFARLGEVRAGRRGIGPDAVNAVGLIDVLDRAQPRMVDDEPGSRSTRVMSASRDLLPCANAPYELRFGKCGFRPRSNSALLQGAVPLFVVRDPGTRTFRCLAKLMRGPARFRFAV